MPFCTSCGAEVAADKKFCPQCGTPVEKVPGPAAPDEPGSTSLPVNPPPSYGTASPQPKKISTPLIIAGIVVVLAIVAAVYFVGLPMFKTNPKSPDVVAQSPSPAITPAPVMTVLPTPIDTPAVQETTPRTVDVRDPRFEEDYEQIYNISQKFSFGQKVDFAYELTRAPLYVKFNLTPVKITRHRLVSIGTNNEHYVNTTETSPQAWFEVKVLNAGSRAVLDQQGFGNDYSDITRQYFMVRQDGNYIIEMSGNDVNADVQMLIGT